MGSLPPLVVWLLFLLGLGLLFTVALWAHVRFWVRRLTVRMEYDAVERLPTLDGSAIDLRHLSPTGEARPGLPPVLLVHGVAANYRNLDVRPERSLARFLAERGRDVWLVTLRSGRGDLTWSERRRVRFHAMVLHDLPLAVDAVLERTGAGQVDYVGFSMGGMLLYGALGRSVPEERVRRAVLVGSPGTVSVPFPLLKLLRFAPELLFPGLRLGLGSRTFAFVSTWMPRSLRRFVVAPDNLDVSWVPAAMVDVVEDIPAPLQADFARWAFHDGTVRVEAEPVLDGLASVRVPALFFAGAADRLASPAAVRLAYDAWGREEPDVDKTFVLLGPEEGAGAAYGHGDMAMGTHAVTDVFEPTACFLAASS